MAEELLLPEISDEEWERIKAVVRRDFEILDRRQAERRSAHPEQMSGRPRRRSEKL